MKTDKKILIDSFTALFECATEGILIADSEGLILHSNPSAHEMFGYDECNILEKVIEDLIPLRSNPKYEELRKSYNQFSQAGSMGKNISILAKKNSGVEFPAEICLSYYAKDSSVYTIYFIVDVTQRKRQEEDIKKLKENLERIVLERTLALQKSLTELELSKKQLSEILYKEKELNSMKSGFITMASHEFRTPLSTILSSLSLIEKYSDKIDEGKRQKHIDRSKLAVANITSLLDDFLSLEKLNENRIKAEYSEFSLKNLIQSAIADYMKLTQCKHEITVRYDGTEIIFQDYSILENVLENLISNACKFSSENTKIEIVTKVAHGQVHISIEDQGIGIPFDEFEHIGKPFFRGRNVTNIQGTGLGLSIIIKKLELIRGKLTFSSEHQKGSVFAVDIPKYV